MRYALYFTPAKTDPLTVAAAQWLGRDPFSGERFPHAARGGLSAEKIAEVTASPRRYGFHATLKAPFRLAAGAREDDLLATLETFAAQTAPIAIPRVVVGNLSGFFALVPSETCAPLNAFAASVVTAFERFRAPLNADEIARRNPDHLSPQEAANLRDWGYPYVLDSFRFHMTLTDRVPLAMHDVLQPVLESYFAPVLPAPFPIDGVALFVEPGPGEPFIVREHFSLTGASERKSA